VWIKTFFRPAMLSPMPWSRTVFRKAGRFCRTGATVVAAGGGRWCGLCRKNEFAYTGFVAVPCLRIIKDSRPEWVFFFSCLRTEHHTGCQLQVSSVFPSSICHRRKRPCPGCLLCPRSRSYNDSRYFIVSFVCVPWMAASVRQVSSTAEPAGLRT